jgi:hypothetical protein
MRAGKREEHSATSLIREGNKIIVITQDAEESKSLAASEDIFLK